MRSKIVSVSLALLTLTGLISCNDNNAEELTAFELVYSNDFENEPYDEIIGASYHFFDSSMVSGNYNNDGFIIQIKDLPEHQQVLLSFDLYIHDSWDGNGDSTVSGPDIWSIQIDDLVPQVESSKNIYITTFANGTCEFNACPYQSYPEAYPNVKSPRAGAATEKLFGYCQYEESDRGTNLYRIERAFQHSSTNLVIRFFDQVVQLNAKDAACDESWSLDNLKVYTFYFED